MMTADIFVILDDVQYPKTGGCWGNRVQFQQQGRPFWLTMPIIRSYHGIRSYHEIEIDQSSHWQKKALKSIQLSYQKAPYFNDIFPLFESLLEIAEKNLLQFNLNAIYHTMNLLKIPRERLLFSSEMKITSTGTDRLVEITKYCQADAYLCGGGSKGYQEDDKFEKNGVKLIYQNFIHPTYPQIGADIFLPGLSIFDYFFNSGTEYLTSNLLRPNTI